MAVLATLTRLLSPNNLTGLVLFGTLITLSVVNPFLGVLALLVTAVLSQARENYGVLEASGIPVVKPTLFCGSEPNLHQTVLHLADIQRFKEFGGVWGVRTSIYFKIYYFTTIYANSSFLLNTSCLLYIHNMYNFRFNK